MVVILWQLLILSINPASSSSVNQSICPSQLPYTWNSQTYNSAGTYSVTLTEIYRMRLYLLHSNLSVLPTTTSTTNQSVLTNYLTPERTIL